MNIDQDNDKSKSDDYTCQLFCNQFHQAQSSRQEKLMNEELKEVSEKLRLQTELSALKQQ